MNQSSFFTDDQYQINVKYIDDAFNLIPNNVTVVIPIDGIGTGLAQLDVRATKTYQYILYKIQQLRGVL